MTTPGLEELALEEWRAKSQYLRDIYPEIISDEQDVEPQLVTGGVELFLYQDEGWIYNHYLRIPTRILQRLVTFQCKNYERLEGKVRHLPWHEYLRQGPIKIHPSYQRTYLNMKKRIEEAVLKNIDHCHQHQGFRKAHLDIPQNVFIRIVENEATISLDTSGELLYRRGYKEFTAEAPVRETLASALYWACFQKLDEPPASVIDPMCGSGTQILEPLIFWKSWRRRSFGYQNFPVAPKLLTKETTSHLPPDKTELKIFGGDLASKSVEATQVNFEKLVKKEKVELDLREGDWLESWQGAVLPKPSILLVNPPYNKRLEADSKTIVKDLDTLINQVQPSLTGVIWPGRTLPSLAGEWVRKISTTNGGVPVTLGVHRR